MSSTVRIVGSTVTEPLIARPTTAWVGASGVTRSCWSQPNDLSEATPVPIDMAEPSAPYAAMPTMEAVFQPSTSSPPMLVKIRYIITGMPVPKMRNAPSRRVRRISSRT